MTIATTATYDSLAMQIASRAARKVGLDMSKAENLGYAMDTLQSLVKYLQTKHVFLWTLEEDEVNLTAATRNYTLDTDCIGVKTVRFKHDGTETILTPWTREAYKELPDKIVAGTPYLYFFDRRLAAPVLFLANVYAHTTSIVTGSDASKYRSIKDHTATADTTPITGTDYATYWELYTGADAAVSHVVGTAYYSGRVILEKERRLKDITYDYNTGEFTSKFLLPLETTLAHKLSFDPALNLTRSYRDELRREAEELMDTAMADDFEGGDVQYSPEA